MSTQKLKIGEIYLLDEYDSQTTSKAVKTTKAVSLKTSKVMILQSVLQQNKTVLIDEFKNHQEKVKEYLKLVKKLDKFKSNREVKQLKRKSDEEKNLEKEILKQKKKLFPLKKKNIFKNKLVNDVDEFVYQTNLLIRNYIPERMTFSNDLVDGINVVIYAGPKLTATGKTVHQWYNISHSFVPEVFLDPISDQYFDYFV